MKTKLSLFMVLLLSIIYCCISAEAEDMIELTVPENMPDSYIGYYWIDGDKTNGVTFVVRDIRCDSQLIEINVMQLPNDDYTSLIDNQVEYPSTATHSVREIE